ncbi:hypothetical protein MMH89_00915 [Candidatus Comchoanobacter bicostacola]|uniref:Uncharacterized protein n=1 Tax=Candidatus Comchoanobacter bicostacola TaxID=2919598 RepID=A0ABY5DLA9_9GAMM|nr:hypothetical protein [Candidatus Comchoanobacter bicostacola]UTC24722.1 hypothetical protein MMH89_00915 [Candidatus Comchoanobacter bicostacola]
MTAKEKGVVAFFKKLVSKKSAKAYECVTSGIVDRVKPKFIIVGEQFAKDKAMSDAFSILFQLTRCMSVQERHILSGELLGGERASLVWPANYEEIKNRAINNDFYMQDWLSRDSGAGNHEASIAWQKVNYFFWNKLQIGSVVNSQCPKLSGMSPALTKYIRLAFEQRHYLK